MIADPVGPTQTALWGTDEVLKAASAGLKESYVRLIQWLKEQVSE